VSFNASRNSIVWWWWSPCRRSLSMHSFFVFIICFTYLLLKVMMLHSLHSKATIVYNQSQNENDFRAPEREDDDVELFGPSGSFSNQYIVKQIFLSNGACVWPLFATILVHRGRTCFGWKMKQKRDAVLWQLYDGYICSKCTARAMHWLLYTTSGGGSSSAAAQQQRNWLVSSILSSTGNSEWWWRIGVSLSLELSLTHLLCRLV
jgi:hypothetical protein